MGRYIFSAIILFTSISSANVSGTHLQNFNPTTDGMCFVSVHCAQTLAPRHANLGIFFNDAFNSLPFFRGPLTAPNQIIEEPDDQLLSMDLSLGLGLTENWDVGLALPFIVAQDINGSALLGAYDKTGLNEWRLNTKYTFLRNDIWRMAAVAGVNFDRINNNPFAGDDPGPTWTGELVFDYKTSEILMWAVNVGYRLRDKGTAIPGTGVKPIGDQVIYSAAVAYAHQPWDVTFIGELFGSTPMETVDLPTDRQSSNLEALAGACYTLQDKWDLHGGVGTEIVHGLATPDFRIYAGLNYRFGPLSDPAPAPVAVRELPMPEPTEPPDEVITLHSMNFDTNLTTLTPSSRAAFQSTIEQLRNKVPDLRAIIVEGHTDYTGTEAHNLRLSQGRAETVRSMLERSLGLTSEQLRALGRGESRPLMSNDSEMGRAQNRRVELKIYRKK